MFIDEVQDHVKATGHWVNLVYVSGRIWIEGFCSECDTSWKRVLPRSADPKDAPRLFKLLCQPDAVALENISRICNKGHPKALELEDVNPILTRFERLLKDNENG